MIISADTKISTLLKVNPACIEAIVSINKHFEKLRNPILRKVLASRVTIADAAKIGGCKVEDFFSKLKELGFETETGHQSNQPVGRDIQTPDYIKNLQPADTITLDVRTDIASGRDPFLKIMETLRQLSSRSVLLIINSFEPVPLINILRERGFEHYTESKVDGSVHTYFKSNAEGEKVQFEDIEKPRVFGEKEFAEIMNKFPGRIKEIDVRSMEMPMPMVTILEELETLPHRMALFVHHKKIPQYLLPELKERNFLWAIKENEPGDVKLLIYR